MKINRKSPLHWLSLLGFGLQSLLGALLRGLPSQGSKPFIVVLYGHKLNGNLLALLKALEKTPTFEPVFLTLDRRYHLELEKQGINSIWAASFSCASVLGQANALVSDHGLHSLEVLINLYKKSGLVFYDVWHGIPFKGFDANDFRVQLMYDEIWVASELHRELYIKRYGFSADKIVVTGYGRTDQLIHPAGDQKDLRKEMGLPEHGPIILFAPTWAQDHHGRSIFPFGIDETSFLSALSDFAKRHNVTFVLRPHLNSPTKESESPPGIAYASGSEWPDTESILLISDMLICDWSSIAFDYLLLDRPTFFLDVPAPFSKGFSLGPEYRFGPIVTDLQDLLGRISTTLTDPESYWLTQRDQHDRIKQEVYGVWADGRASQRYVARLDAAGPRRGKQPNA